MDTRDKLRLNRKREVKKVTCGKAHLMDTQEREGSIVKLGMMSNSEGLEKTQS